MKKFLSTLIVTAMVALGLVASSGGPASAACPYSACITTTTSMQAPSKVKFHHRLTVAVAVAAPGNSTPTGSISVILTKSNGHVKFTATQPYSGGTVSFTTRRLSRGKYTVGVTYAPSAGLVFTTSTTSAEVICKKKPHHHHH